MWVLRYLFFYVMLSVFGLALVLFLLQNSHTEQLEFFGLEYTTNMIWVMVGAGGFGALIVLILLLPGRLAAMLRNWSVEREIRHMEQDLGQLEDQREFVLNRHEDLLEAHERLLQGYHRLMAEHSRTIADRDRARSQLAARDAELATKNHVAPAASPARLALPAPQTTREQSTLPDRASTSPVAAAVGVQASGALGGRSPSGQRSASASDAVADQAGGRERERPGEAAHTANRSAPPASAAPAALLLTTEALAPTGSIDPAPAQPAPQARANPIPIAPAAAPRPAPLQRTAISSRKRLHSIRLLATLRVRLRDSIAKSAARSAARSVALQDTVMAKLAQLKQLRLPGSLSVGPTGDTSVDPPDSNDLA